MTDLICWPGYHHWSPAYGTKIFETAGSRVWGNRSYKQRNLEPGTWAVAEVDQIRLFYFPVRIRGWARRLLGNMTSLEGGEQKGEC